MDLGLEVGSPRISTCPLNDGHDYVFEANYLDAYRWAEETFAAICAHNPAVRLSIEYKWNDPRTRCLLASAGETLVATSGGVDSSSHAWGAEDTRTARALDVIAGIASKAIAMGRFEKTRQLIRS